MGTRGLFVILAAELLWIECGSGNGARVHVNSLVSLLEQGNKADKKTLPMPDVSPVHATGLPRTYLLVFVTTESAIALL